MKILLTLLISTYILYASSHIECTGIVTLTHVEEVLEDEKVPTALVDMKVKAKYFKCVENGSKMPIGDLKQVRILLNGTIPKSFKHYLVYFSNGDSAPMFFDDFSFDTPSFVSWKFIKKVPSASYRSKDILKYHNTSEECFTDSHVQKHPYVPKKGVDLYMIEKLWKVNKEVKNENK